MQVLYPDQAELDRELASLLEEEKAAVLKLRASFDDRRRLATERFRERMADARKREIELRANLEEERAARKAAQSAEDERIKAIEIERIAVEYEAQRARDEAKQAQEQAQLNAELQRQRMILAASQPKDSAQADGKFEHRQYNFEEGLPKKLATFKRASKGNSALVLRIDHDAGEIQVQGEYVETSLEKIAADLSEAIPAYILYILRWQHADGRTQYPFCLVGFMPQAVPPHLRVMYARPVTDLRDHLAVNKHFTCEDIDELTEEWLVHKLEGGR